MLLYFQIIDPFVEVEIIGLPMDCSKQQTRVVDDNGAPACTLQRSVTAEWTACNVYGCRLGFNPMWEETLVFNIQMPQVALVRFQVWDHDPIGQDFIGQRTIALTSMMPGRQDLQIDDLMTEWRHSPGISKSYR